MMHEGDADKAQRLLDTLEMALRSGGSQPHLALAEWFSHWMQEATPGELADLVRLARSGMVAATLLGRYIREAVD